MISNSEHTLPKKEAFGMKWGQTYQGLNVMRITESITLWLAENAPPLAIALGGGLVDFLFSDDHSIFQLVTGLVASAFLGYVVILCGMEYGLSEYKIGITCALAGYLCRPILRAIRVAGPVAITGILNAENIVKFLRVSDRSKGDSDGDSK